MTYWTNWGVDAQTRADHVPIKRTSAPVSDSLRVAASIRFADGFRERFWASCEHRDTTCVNRQASFKGNTTSTEP
jgi:hypothetical protein